ncbi:MAG: cytidine deaminase [Gemmatimonadaceae bacterium]|nr:cytidine deaminase [Gemmatimonadaceae bacterium]
MAELREAASAAMRRAYAPYSGFRVGAALLGTDGVIYTGCNVENSSFPAGICAERNALVAAVNAGRLEFAHLVIVAGSDSPVPPCGLCRQALVEFAPELPITSVGARGMTETWSLAELLPAPFTGDSLRRG